jgi:hypothetical protein
VKSKTMRERLKPVQELGRKLVSIFSGDSAPEPEGNLQQAEARAQGSCPAESHPQPRSRLTDERSTRGRS